MAAMINAILIAMNIAALVLALVILTFFRWSGPGFALGTLFGILSFFIYTRLKLGYWI